MRASEFTKQELDEKINPQVVEPGFTAEKKLGNRYVMKAEARYTGEPGDDLRGLIIKVYDTKAKPTMLNWGIGMTRFVARQDPTTQDWYLVSSTTHVDDRYQRQGLASAMYNWARELGNDIEPSSNRTKMGKHFWEKGAGAGREFVDQPPETAAPPAIPTAAGPAKAQSLRDRLVKMFTEEPDLAERKQSPLEDFEGLQFRMVNDNGQLFVNAFDSTWGNELGHVTFNIGDGKDLDPQDLFVKEKFQGQGIARLMYDFVKSKGYKIQRSWDQTDAGAGFWDKHRGEERVWEQDVTEGSSHQHTEIIKHRAGDWIVYLDNHSVIRAMTRNIGPRMMSNLVTMVDMIPDLEDKVPKGGAFWIQDIKTNSSFYFKRLDIPSEPLAVRCETGVQDIPRANKQTPVFQVNAYTGPETKQAIQGMKQVKLRSKFVGTNTLANTLASNIQKGKLGGNDAIRNPATQDSKRYDTAFKQAQRMDKEVDENFADGKNPQDKGDSVRHGIPKNATMAELEKASHAAGRKGQLARWQLNMRRGHKK